MLTEMRREDRRIGEEESLKILNEGLYGVLSTVGEGSYAYGVPLSYAYEQDKIYFHCAKEGHKIRNIERNPEVSFCIVGSVETIPEKFSTKYESVILFGRVKRLEGEEKKEGLRALIRKYSADHIDAGNEYIDRAAEKALVFCINISEISGKARR